MIRLRKLLMMNWTISPLFLSSHTVQCIYYATLLSLMQHAGLGWARHRLCQLTVYWRNYTSLVKSAQVCQKWWPGVAMLPHKRGYGPFYDTFCPFNAVFAIFIRFSCLFQCPFMPIMPTDFAILGLLPMMKAWFFHRKISLVVGDCIWTVLRKQWKKSSCCFSWF